MTKEGSTKIVYFNTPMAEVLMLGRGHISYFSEYVLSSTLSIYSTLTNLNPLYQWMPCTKFGLNCPCRSREEVENVKSLQRQLQRQTTDKF